MANCLLLPGAGLLRRALLRIRSLPRLNWNPSKSWKSNRCHDAVRQSAGPTDPRRRQHQHAIVHDGGQDGAIGRAAVSAPRAGRRVGDQVALHARQAEIARQVQRGVELARGRGDLQRFAKSTRWSSQGQARLVRSESRQGCLLAEMRSAASLSHKGEAPPSHSARKIRFGER
jgi:hypothetical protein